MVIRGICRRYGRTVILVRSSQRDLTVRQLVQNIGGFSTAGKSILQYRSCHSRVINFLKEISCHCVVAGIYIIKRGACHGIGESRIDPAVRVVGNLHFVICSIQIALGPLCLLYTSPLKIQRDFYTKPEKELTHAEYGRLIRAAQKKQNDRLALLLQTICATGIRVSELKFITVDAMCTGRATVDCKGKTRTVFLPKELCRILRHYCKKQNIEKGSIFCTSSGTPLDRTNIWRDMKSLCKSAGVEPGKVFPHNLRHLFARTYYQLEKDLSRLADLLGHSSLTTTRIYTMESGIEHEKLLNRMNLVLAKK